MAATEPEIPAGRPLNGPQAPVIAGLADSWTGGWEKSEGCYAIAF